VTTTSQPSKKALPEFSGMPSTVVSNTTLEPAPSWISVVLVIAASMSTTAGSTS
jgi:hypothetical protein